MKVDFPHCDELPECTGGEIQTRSEHTGLIQHKTLEDAVKAAQTDKSIWKISYRTENGPLRQVIR